MSTQILAMAADHGGYALKEALKPVAEELGWQILDLGTHSTERVDSLDYAVAMAKALKAKQAHLGVLICKSGNGIAMAANRFSVVRAAVVHNSTTAYLARAHNDANVMALGAEMVGLAVATDALRTFLQAQFLGGRYADRRDKLTALNPEV